MSDLTERVARAGWPGLCEMIDGHREQAAKTDDTELAAMLLKDAALYEVDVLTRARAAIRQVLVDMYRGSGNHRVAEFIGRYASEHDIAFSADDD